MKKKMWYKYFIEYLGITIGCAIMGISLSLFLVPNTIAPGGVSGIGIIIQKLTGISVSISNIAINIPLLIIGVVMLGAGLGIKTIYSIVALSFFIEVFEKYMYIDMTHDILLATIFGGLLLGSGIGMVFRNGGTTGGTALAGAMISKMLKGLSVQKAMILVDLAVVVSAGIVTKNIEISLYSLIALYLILKSADFVIEGMGYSKAFFIISDKETQISDKIMSELGRGVTALKGKGMYTKSDKEILMVVIDRLQEVKLKEIVLDIDEGAFVMVSNINEVLGEGFKPIKA